jgi:hypothetical protein
METEWVYNAGKILRTLTGKDQRFRYGIQYPHARILNAVAKPLWPSRQHTVAYATPQLAGSEKFPGNESGKGNMNTKYPYGDVTDGQKTAIFNKLGGRKALDRFLADQLVVTEPSPTRRLKFCNTAECPEIKRFIAKENFGRGKVINGVKFYDLGDNFIKVFVPKVETDIEAAVLRSHELLRNSKDLAILREMEGGKEIIALAHFHHLLTLQGEGQEGTLLVNGYANIFYIVGTDGNLWVVHAFWYDDGWHVFAYPVECPDGWGAGRRAFSR